MFFDIGVLLKNTAKKNLSLSVIQKEKVVRDILYTVLEKHYSEDFQIKKNVRIKKITQDEIWISVFSPHLSSDIFSRRTDLLQDINSGLPGPFKPFKGIQIRS